MSVHTFDSYHRSIDNHYKKKAVDIYNNRKKSYGKMSSYIDFLTGYDNNSRTIFKAPAPKYINMSKVPNGNNNTPLVVCKNDKLEYDNSGNKIITKPFTWFINNNNHFDTANEKRNNNLLDNLIKNDSDLYKDTYLYNILNGSVNCTYTAGKMNNMYDDVERRTKILRNKYKDGTITKEEFDKSRHQILSNIPWVSSMTKDEELGKYKFKDGFSNYQETKKQLGLTYFASLSIIILFIIYRLK